MITLLLLCHACALGWAGTLWLPRTSWPLRAPRLGIAAWQALTLAVIASVVLAGLILAVQAVPATAMPAWLLRACLVSGPAQHAGLGGQVAGVAGALLAVAVGGRAVWHTVAGLARARRLCARHDDALTIVARHGPLPGVLLLEDDTPAAYCVPGSRRIVVTTGAMACLDHGQLEAVLEHERAHLAGRHHLIVTLATALHASFSRVRLFSVAASQIACLAEMAADDAAAQRSHRLALADALLTMAASPAPVGTLGAGGSAAAQRIRRLIEPPPPRQMLTAAKSAAVLMAVSALAFSAPAITLVVMTRCVPGLHLV